MKKTGIIFGNALRRGRVFLLLSVVAGILLCFVFHLLNNVGDTNHGSIPVGFLDEDGSAVSQDLRRYLSDELGMKLVESEDLAYLDTELVEKHVSTIIQVPAGFESGLLAGEDTALTLTFLDDYANTAFIESYIESYTASLQMLLAGADGDAATLHLLLDAARKNTPAIETTALDAQFARVAAEQEAFSYTVGFYLMVSFLLVMALSNMLHDDRRNGMFQRVKASSVQTWQYISGICLMGFVGVAVMSGVILGYVALTGISTGIPLWQAALLCFAYGVVIIAVALFVALYLPSRNSIMAAIVGGSTVTCLLGGAYFPIETAPAAMQTLARGTPQFWVVDMLSGRENTGASLIMHLAILLLFALLFVILAGVRFAQADQRVQM